ncbi:MAG: hypothetical protein RBQ97_09455 [Acholeplasma sp.]|nr:hypothetical protein [Acholeplasma sp.]
MKFAIHYFDTQNFYDSVISEYISFRRSGFSRTDSNKRVISSKITGNSSFVISPEASQIISRFDVLDSVQFLIRFNNSLSFKLDSIPKMSSGNLVNNTRQNLLSTAFKKEQWQYVNSIPDLRNNTIDLYQDFTELGSMLIRDCNLYYRLQQ